MSLEKIANLKGLDKPRYPIIQGGMGAGISLMPLAAEVSRSGAMGTISSAGIDYFTSNRIGIQLNQKEAIAREIEDTKKEGGFAAINIMCILERSWESSIEGAVMGEVNMILSGAGLPTNLPDLVKKYYGSANHNIALVPIISSVRALEILRTRYWDKQGYIPDAIVLEGPKAGGHIGWSYKDIKRSGENFLEEYDLLDVLLPQILEITEKDNIPVFVAGGIRTKEDITDAMAKGAAGVQIGSPFVAAYESGASEEFKKAIIESKNKDVLLGTKEWGSACNYPFRYLKDSPLAQKTKENTHFCICTALMAASCSYDPKKGECPEKYVLPFKRTCPASGNASYNGMFTSGTEIDSITKMKYAKDIIKELVE